MSRYPIAFVFSLSLLVFSIDAAAQGTPSRGWLDVNFLGVRSQQEEQSVAWTTRLFGETASVAAAYPKIEGIGKAIEIGGGVRFGSGGPVGIGVHFDAANIRQIVGLAATIPHPLFFNRAATGVGVSGELERKDRAVDFQVTYFVPSSSAWALRIFGGPTFFSLEEERVSTVRYQQVFTVLGGNVITITPPDVANVDGSSWGFNVGADIGVFFSRHVGVGGTVRFNRGQVNLDDPLSGLEVQREAGHVVFGGGLRLRF